MCTPPEGFALVRFILARHELVTGEVNLVELRRVLRDRFHATPAQLDAVERELRDQTVEPKPRRPSTAPIPDPDDRWVLASAEASKAELLVTGDQDLLGIAEQASIRIVSPRGCWDQLRRAE